MARQRKKPDRKSARKPDDKSRSGVADAAQDKPKAESGIDTGTTVPEIAGNDGSPPSAETARSTETETETLPAPGDVKTRVAAETFSSVPSYSTASAGDIRGVLIQVVGARLLLPNATIAEVLSYAPPEPVGDTAPEWLLGRMRWRGWQLPLLAFSRMAGIGQEQAGLGSKVVVLKALAGNAKAPYFAMVTQGFPRLVTVSREALVLDDDVSPLPQGIRARVLLNEDAALIPDLEAIERLVGDAIAQASAQAA